MERYPSSPGQSKFRRGRALIVGAGIFAITLLALAGIVSYVRSEQRKAVEVWQARLTAMADDREAAIEAWLDERWGDGQVVAEFPSVRALLGASAGQGGEERAHLSGILSSLSSSNGYLGVYVLGPEAVSLAASLDAPPVATECVETLRAMPSGQNQRAIVFKGVRTGKAWVGFVVRVRAGAAAPTIGWVLLVMDPERWLFPLLQREPVPTRTGESVLSYRDGADLVFITPLRFRPSTPLSVKVPFENTALAGQHAILGQRVFGEFVDYRNAPILAAVRPISTTDWGMVVKVDRDEALAPFRRAMVMQGLGVLGVLCTLVGAGYGLWRNQDVRALNAVIAERSRSESRILQLNRLLRTISEINQLVVKEGDRRALLSEACRILVEHGQYVAAWVGFKMAEGGVEFAAQAGNATDYLKRVRIRWDDSPGGRGPTGTAIRENRPVLVPDLTLHSVADSWCEEALKAGYLSSVAVPVPFRKSATAALTVYAAETGTIGKEEMALLEELAADLGYALEAIQDREERGKAEEALRENEERFRSLYENATIGLYRTTPDGRILMANPTLLRLLGHATMEELVRRNLEKDGFEPSYPRGSFLEAIERDGEVRGWESSWARSNGTPIFVRESARAIRDEAGRTLYYDGTVEDITERRQADEALRESEGRFRSLFKNMLNGFAYCQMIGGEDRLNDFIYLEVNDAFEALTGLKGVVGRRVSEVIPGILEADPGLMERYARVALSGVPEQFETFVEALGMWFDISVYSPSKNHFVAVFDVITKRKQTQEENLRLNKELEQRVKMRTAELTAANQELEAFSYSVSHDLRAPLRAIDGFSAALVEDCGRRLDKDGRRLLSVIRSATQQMGTLIDDLLAFSRAGRQELRGTAVNMNALARSVFDDQVPETGRAEVTFRLAPMPDATGDATLLRQVWSNLLGNAVKFSRGTSPVVEAGGHVEDGEAVYYVRDNGVGFDERYAHKLFGVFQRLHRSEEFEGTGVGLAIVKRIVTRHGGRVWAESRQGEGAAFFFSLPAREGESDGRA